MINNIVKLSAIQLSYEITDVEKLRAEKSLLYFEHAIKALNKASEYLNIIKNPFKDNPNINTNEIIKYRAALRRFRDKAIDNFNNFKRLSFYCVKIMDQFISDTQTIKLIKSFISSVEVLEDKVNDFVILFKDLSSKDLVKSIINNIEDVQNQCEEINEIVDDRIKTHIYSNILSKTWINSVNDTLQEKLEDTKPLIMDLFDKRQQQLNNAIKERKVVD